MKKILIIGAIALVIIGGILAAGCTSNTTQQQTQNSDIVTDDIVGIWFCENNANDQKETDIILEDGTGYWYYNSKDGIVTVGECTWTKNADGTYLMKWSDDEVTTWTLNPTKDIITSSKGLKFMKKQINNLEDQNVLGPWYNEEKKILAIFHADGTGIYKTGNFTENFTWTIPEFGKFKLHVLNGEYEGNDYIWEYDRVKNTFYTADGDETYVRPSDSKDGLIITKFTT